MTPEATDAIVDAIEQEDLDSLALLAVGGASAAFTTAQLDRIWRAFPELGSRAQTATLMALVGVGYVVQGSTPNVLLDALVRDVEGSDAAAIETLLSLGVRVTSADPQHEAIADDLDAMGSADLVRVLPLIARFGFRAADYPGLLERHADDANAVRLLLEQGADPNVRHDGQSVFDRALQGPRPDPAGHIAALELMAAHVAIPLERVAIEELRRLGGDVPDPAAWRPGAMPRALWMFSETRWPQGTTLANESGSLNGVQPKRLEPWSRNSGWGLAEPAGFLWLWTTSEVQTMLALRPAANGGASVYALDHEQSNQLGLGRRLAPWLGELKLARRGS